MAKMGILLDTTEKKLTITRFLPVESRQEGIEDYVTIKKIPYIVRKKIETLSINSISGQTGKELFKYLKKSGKKAEDFDNMDNTEKMEIMLNAKITDEEANSISKTTSEIIKLTINNGLDPTKHTIYGIDDKPIYLDYNALESIGNSLLIEYIVNEINNFGKGFVLGEEIARI